MNRRALLIGLGVWIVASFPLAVVVGKRLGEGAQ